MGHLLPHKRLLNGDLPDDIIEGILEDNYRFAKHIVLHIHIVKALNPTLR